MSLPTVFERTRQRLDLPAPALDESLSNIAPLPGTGRTLTFEMQQQIHTEWCWAAVAVSVSNFYNPASNLRQCRLANSELERDDCCGSAGSSACNIPNTLDTVLSRTGHLRGDIVDEPLSFQAVKQEIDNRRLLCCRIGWLDGGGHFNVLHGVSTDSSGGSIKRWVAVADPLYGPSNYLVDNFTSAYRQGTGEWTHSYFTQ